MAEVKPVIGLIGRMGQWLGLYLSHDQFHRCRTDSPPVKPVEFARLTALAKAAQTYTHTWYTADELRKHRAMPESDGNFIAAFTPQVALDLLEMLDLANPDSGGR